jgi:RNA-dependent RNA polymerase
LRNSRARPDFLANEAGDLTGQKYYDSPKLLGQLFRRVPVRRWMPQQWNGSRSPSDGDTVKGALSRVVSLYNLGLPGLPDPNEELTEEMSYLLDAYCERLLAIGQAHTIIKNKNNYVSEAELVSGTIMASWSDHGRRREEVAAMNLEVSIALICAM